LPTLAEHQREAVARAMELLEKRGGVLLADAVGLGKSFVAAAVAKRFTGEVELIVPASLVEQWRGTLALFHAEAEIVTHDCIRREPALGRLLIVDEAHAFRNPHTRRYDALARRAVGARVLLVTATPVCNSAADLEALLAVIARDDLLADAGVPSVDLAFALRDREQLAIVMRELVIRRERDVLPRELAFGDLQRTIVRHPVLDARGIDALRFPLSGSEQLLRRFLWRRLESSEAALAESLRRQQRFYERVLESGRALSRREYRRAFGCEEDREVFQQILFWDLFAPPDEVDAGAVRDELQRIAELRAFVARSPCAKRELLVNLLTNEPVLIFTESAATARDLAKFLRCGCSTARDGRGAIEAFRRGAIDRLVATDLASEGLNLQRAGVVVHYDIPWNPVKLDQRNGRAHRIGQTRESVRAIYFVPEREGALDVVARKNVARKRMWRTADRSVCATTLPARVTRDAAIVKAALDDPRLERRNRAGLERMLRDGIDVRPLLAREI
jgi:superfamily II DNA or RNA helicase